MAAKTRGNAAIVLVVEDEALLRMAATDLVEDAGFEAIEASNADEAIRILEERTDIHIVFTDVDMPGSMDGLKLAEAVRGSVATDRDHRDLGASDRRGRRLAIRLCVFLEALPGGRDRRRASANDGVKGKLSYA